MRISFSISSRTESGSVEGTVRSASEDELVGELLCESELLKIKFGFLFDEDVPTDSEEVRVCGSIGDEELPSEHARNIAIGKANKTFFSTYNLFIQGREKPKTIDTWCITQKKICQNHELSVDITCVLFEHHLAYNP